MAKNFGTDYFTRQAEMMRSAASDEEVNLQLDIAVPKLHHDLHLPFAAPTLNRAPALLSSGQRAYASSTTRNDESRCSGVGSVHRCRQCILNFVAGAWFLFFSFLVVGLD